MVYNDVLQLACFIDFGVDPTGLIWYKFPLDIIASAINFGVDPTGLIWYTSDFCAPVYREILELTPQG